MNALTIRIAELKETIALCTADLRYCNTREQVQSVNAVIAARKAELAELEAKAQTKAEAEALTARIAEVQDTLKEDVTVKVINTDRDGNRQVEIACGGLLMWRAWEYETDFMSDFERELTWVVVDPVLDEQAFINRCVVALDSAPMGDHGVYVHWFSIGYGEWLDAEEVVLAGGLADYLEALGLSAGDVAELMVQDWDCQDAEGLAARCLHNYGGFDWLGFEELLEVDVPAPVLTAGLECGLEPEAIEEAYMGEWDSAEDMAYDQWDQCGMLESVPESARGYINWELVARDMVLGGDVTEANGHYFRAA